MVDPVNLTNYKRSTVELEEALLWSVLVAGKNAINTAKALDIFLIALHRRFGLYVNLPKHGYYPFEVIRHYTVEDLQPMLKSAGIGCHTSKSKSIHQLANSRLDLTVCTVDDLEKIHGIGPKTARMFILHTRPNASVAVLDIHVLRYMADNGIDVPVSTPTGKKYKDLEIKFLMLARKAQKTVADFDLMIWRKYSGREVA